MGVFTWGPIPLPLPPLSVNKPLWTIEKGYPSEHKNDNVFFKVFTLIFTVLRMNLPGKTRMKR